LTTVADLLRLPSGPLGEDEVMLRILWEDEAEKDNVLEILKAECEIRAGRPP
jgi:hypothetical protein